MYIEIQDATKIYEKPGGFRSSRESFTALDHISLQIGKGEFICLLGPSGCGKTTLMNSIAGFETLTEGSITIDGQKVKAPSEKYVTIFQNYGLLPWRTVEKNVEWMNRLEPWMQLRVTNCRMIFCILQNLKIKQ